MKRYIKDLVRVNLIMMACVGTPALFASLFGLHRENGLMLLVMCLGFALAVFAVCMLPSLRFWWMIRRQEKLGLPFPNEEPRRIDLGWTGTYLTQDWLIYAGIHALHHSQIAAIHGKRINPGRFAVGHLIIVKTVNGRTYRWHLSQRNVKIIRDWLKAHQAAN
ncbi:MAG: hypothetical protein E7318_05145 [Clostridiales bacterium]|nr:hypothetical protein [Clostridiales bacterium]